MIFFSSALFAVFMMALTLVVIQLIKNAFRAYQQNFFDTTQRGNLHGFLLSIEPRQLLLINLSVSLLLGAAIWVASGNWIASALSSIAALFAYQLIFRRLKKKYKQKIIEQLPELLSNLATNMRAGCTIKQALLIVVPALPVPIHHEFLLLNKDFQLGLAFDDALIRLQQRLPLEGVYLFASILNIAKQKGGDQSLQLSRLGKTLSSKNEIENKLSVLTAGSRMQGLLMSLLPYLIAAGLYRLEPESMRMLFTEPLGWATVAAILFLQILGYLSIQRVVNIDV